MRLRPLSSGVLVVALATSTVVGVPALAVGAPPATAADIVINEVESNGDPVGDWVELANTNADQELDISGWTLIDNDPTHTPYTFAEGAVIESGGYLSVYTDEGPLGFGLGANDTVTLRDAAGTVVNSTTWSGHAATTWGRIPDKTGEFAETAEPTRSGRNASATVEEPVKTSPWPLDPQTIEAVALGGDFAGDDMSGVDIAADGTAYVVNNGTGALYVLAYDRAKGSYSVTRTYELKYTDGTGIPDAEGVTVGAGGAIYVATERNNADKGTSRPSILRFSLPESDDEGTLNATVEYDLTDIVGEIGANAGLEAVEYLRGIPGDVYAVGVEGTGKVHFITLGADGAVLQMQTYQSPFQGVMALDYDEARKTLRVLCDEVCEGRSLEMTFNGTEWVTDGTLYTRPAEMGNIANEGFATRTETVECTVNGTEGTATRIRVLWADDAATDGVGLRTAVSRAGECTPSGVGSLDLGSLTDGEGSMGGFASLLGSVALVAAVGGGIHAVNTGMIPLPALPRV